MKRKQMLQSLMVGVGLLMGGPLLALPALADTPGQHPHYLHALSDLRHARWLLNHPEDFVVGHQEADAIDNIDWAIAELKRASIDDGKNLDINFPEDANLEHQGRLRRTRDLLRHAHRDIDFSEDDQAALGWRDGARRHIDEALEHVNRVLHDEHWDDSGF